LAGFWTQVGAYVGAMAVGSFAGLTGMAYLAPMPPSGIRLPFSEMITGAATVVAVGVLPFLLPFLLSRWIIISAGGTGPLAAAAIWAIPALLVILLANGMFPRVLGVTGVSIIWIVIGGAVAGLVYWALGGMPSALAAGDAP
jgi:hypothetical protein